MRKIETLKKNYEFENVLSRGKFYKGKYITLYLQKRKEEKNVIGIAVSKKIGKAFKRNRIKRLIRESYRLQKDNIIKGYNIVFIWNKNVEVNQIKCFTLTEDMIYLLKKSGIYK